MEIGTRVPRKQGVPCMISGSTWMTLCMPPLYSTRSSASGRRGMLSAMAQPITEADVRQVAKLSRLRLSDEQVHHFTGQLAAILDHVSQLDGLDVDGVEPLAHAADRHSVMRDDVERAGLPLESALANAPDRQDPFFGVPKVLGDGGGA